MEAFARLSIACVASAILSLDALANGYVLEKGDRTFCNLFLQEVRPIEPAVPKNDPAWPQLTEKCPSLLTDDRSVRKGRRSDDYALYQTDIDNDGTRDTVLYRRFTRPRYVSEIVEGRELRRQESTESTEEFLIVDLQSCATELVFSEYAKNDLIEVAGQSYIQNVNPYDAGKAKAIYKKTKGRALIGSYQDELCLFTVKRQVKRPAK